MENRYEFLETAERGMFFEKKRYEDTPVFTYEEVKDRLPMPVLAARPVWISCYRYALKTLFSHIYQPEKESGFVSNFVDAAFNQDIFLNDTAFMSLFCNLLHPYVPGIRSLDNFYCKQFEDGEISRELVRASGQEYLPWVNKFHSSLCKKPHIKG